MKSSNQITMRCVVIPIIIIVAAILVFVYWRYQCARVQTEEALKNFSVETATDYDVVNEETSTARGSRKTYSGGESGVSGSLFWREADHDRVAYEIDSLRGFLTVSASDVENEKLTLKIISSMEAGEGKIAIIQDDKVLEYIDFGSEIVREYDITEESLFLVKVICDNAKIKIKVERTIIKND